MARPRHRTVLSLVERGWQAARQCSLDLQPTGIQVIHLIKGRLFRSVRTLIEPTPHVRMLSIPRAWFWPAVGMVGLGLWLAGRLRGVVVDNDRAYRRLSAWARAFRVSLTRIQEGEARYELWTGGRQVSWPAWCEQIAGPCASR